MMWLVDITWLLFIGILATLLLGSNSPNWQQKIIALVFAIILLMPLLPPFHITIDRIQTVTYTPIQMLAEEQTQSASTPAQIDRKHPPLTAEPNELQTLSTQKLLWWLWLSGMVVATIQQLIQVLRLHAIKNRAQLDSDSNRIKVYTSDEVTVPMLMALGRSTILLPSAIKHWPAHVQQQVINHERRHHQRKDHWLLWLAVVVRIIYWFHPMVHWLFKRHKTVTELACDQDLIEQGSNPVHYAQAMIACVHPNACQVFNGMSSHRKQVKQRMQALLQKPKRKPSRWQHTALLILGSGLLAGCVDWQLNRWVPADQLIVATTKDLPSIRQQNPPPGKAHLAVFYDGVDYGQTHVRLKIVNQNKQSWLSLGPLQKFNQYIHTWHLELTAGSRFTGEYEVLGVEPDGVIDGVAVGLIFTDDQGRLMALQSKAAVTGETPNFICSWPLGLYDEEFIAVLPQLTQDNPDSVRRLLCGAQLVDNGLHQLN